MKIRIKRGWFLPENSEETSRQFIVETMWKGKYWSMDTTKNRKRKRNFLPKKWRDLRTKGIHKYTETYLKCFDDHRCLSRSEESKCMWTQGKDCITWEYCKSATRGGARKWRGWKENWMDIIWGKDQGCV